MGNCSNCGAELRPGANFCSTCGAAQSAVAPAETFEPDAAKPAEQASAVRSDGGTSGGTSAAAQTGQYAAPKKIEDYLIRSIIATACCCIPFGIAGIVYAARVAALLKKGDRAGAEEASKKAGLRSALAIGEGVVINALAFALTIIYQVKAIL